MMQAQLMALRAELAALERQGSDQDQPKRTFSLGFAGIDKLLGGGLAHGALHEICAATQADIATASGFTAILALRATAKDQPIVWVRQTYAGHESGHLYAPGLSALGCDPDRLILVELDDPLAVLRAGLEASRCSALGAVIIAPWGAPKMLDFTTTRRLALAAAQSETPVLMLRSMTITQHSAALTRWQVAARASRPRAANAPGMPGFDITLMRYRTGNAGQNWYLEWDHENRILRQPERDEALSRAVVSFPARRSSEASAIPPDIRVQAS